MSLEPFLSIGHDHNTVQYSPLITSYMHGTFCMVPCTINCDAQCNSVGHHAAHCSIHHTRSIWRGSCKWPFLPPAMCGPATAIIKPHGSSSSLHVRYYMFFLILCCILPTQDGLNCNRSTEATGMEEDSSF